MSKYILTGKGEGTYDSNNPLTDDNLFELGSSNEATDHSTGEDITTSTYTLSPNDKDKWLRFTATDCTVTIPQDIWSQIGAAGVDFEIEGEMIGSGTLTFVAGTGVTLRKPTDLTTTIPQNGVFGLKWRYLADVVIFGTLNPA